VSSNVSAKGCEDETHLDSIIPSPVELGLLFSSIITDGSEIFPGGALNSTVCCEYKYRLNSNIPITNFNIITY
jgi:hypothetical protein